VGVASAGEISPDSLGAGGNLVEAGTWHWDRFEVFWLNRAKIFADESSGHANATLIPVHTKEHLLGTCGIESRAEECDDRGAGANAIPAFFANQTAALRVHYIAKIVFDSN
jgi:hypothetical protein